MFISFSPVFIDKKCHFCLNVFLASLNPSALTLSHHKHSTTSRIIFHGKKVTKEENSF